MELTMEEVAAAARCASPPSLPTCELLAQLFPSAAGVSACVPSADGLGYACADLLPRACTPGCPAGCCAKQGEAGKQCGKLVEPLPGGGLLAFALAQPPAEVERALMRAFAAALADHLHPKVRRRLGLGRLRSGGRAEGRDGRHGCWPVQQTCGSRCRGHAALAWPPADALLPPLCPSWPLIHLPSIPCLSHLTGLPAVAARGGAAPLAARQLPARCLLGALLGLPAAAVGSFGKPAAATRTCGRHARPFSPQLSASCGRGPRPLACRPAAVCRIQTER